MGCGASTLEAQNNATLKTRTEILKSGEGSVVAASGNYVTVHATGMLATSGKQFWCTKDSGQQPFSYTAGVGAVIHGWDQGCLGMRIGEVRILHIPPAEAYGRKGFPAWEIPPDAPLRFQLECLSIQDNPPAAEIAAGL
mmetsp:Transcript_52514/g.87104  ORF Transcript_52514/g.87104 Transcript_52514/m.87104 type:complete len:139 (+) Transcript_52514:240-656(+)|eukprot:CAMPEP_0119302596 /NCGR_PEP_ID=MMETSP1333-20130426/4172_1 /TAXON_ID=418940 /ORGANISM="Scyphosphaera apsteinii, Strain RCC1455" /LENGTH=138 /DNA_ID=CAMNT_0007304997 /DNA_START=236 /DNA_END=652 /DNA_ORIENTATION=-